jgi:hypothetical protein
VHQEAREVSTILRSFLLYLVLGGPLPVRPLDGIGGIPMKRTSLACCMGLFVLGMSLSASANLTVTIQEGLYQAGVGGEFNAMVISSDISELPVGYEFATFCMEKNEYLQFGTTYYASVNTFANYGGIAGQLPGTHIDPLDPRTAWLYNEFSNGTLSGYDFSTTTGRKKSAEALQHAIWYLEQEETTTQINQLSTSLKSATWGFINQANASPWTETGTIGDIRILNLTSDFKGMQRAQDVLCPEFPPAVPTPGAILLTGLGTTIVGLIRRQRAIG